MGRISDLWKSETAPDSRPMTLEVVPEPGPELDDWFGGAESVPFIEVGEPQETNLRVVAVPASEVLRSHDPEPQVQLEGETLPPGLFTIHFRPVIAGMLPGRGFGPELIAYHDTDHPISEQYRLLLAEIALQLPSGPPRVLLFTGATVEAGTSTVVLNLAATIARLGAARVTVVDANLTRPSLGDRLGLAVGPGLQDVAAGRTPLPWAVQNTRLPTLRALTAGKAGPFNDAALPPILERLRSDADWVLIDAPTWSRPADAVPLADCCDALYLVVRQPDADTDASMELQQGFLDTTGRLKGCIVTQR